ncbi:hypothetical protein MBLNU457_3819t1 [Dothideomycetes sp. NU457]
MLVSLTVGKVDAGVAVLLTEDKRLIEFPSILLPPEITSGSIVDINVSRNFQSEQTAAEKFAALQSEIFSTFGQATPATPVLRCRNATQTSIVLEWDPISLATAELRSLSLYRNGSKAGNIPRDKLSTKISGLAVDSEYTFHLVLRTSAGTYNSEKLVVRTQKMTDLTGITITTGIMPAQLREDLEQTVQRIQAKMIDTVRIDTTHFVCTEGRGQAWEKAMEMNVPVVVPDWIKGCEREGRIVGVRGYYLNADPKLRQVGPSTTQQASDRRASQQVPQSPQQPRVEPPTAGPTIETTPPTPEQTSAQRFREQNNKTNGEVPPTPPPKMEKFPDAPTSMPENDGEHEPNEPVVQEPESTNEGHGETPVELVEPQEENALKNVGIPHRSAEEVEKEELEAEQVRAATETDKETDKEGDGNFDEVAL